MLYKESNSTWNHVVRQGRIYVFNLSSAACDKLIPRAVIAVYRKQLSTLTPKRKVDFTPTK